MKFLIFSDSHREISVMERVVNATPDAAMMIHLGDLVADAKTLSSLFPRIPLRMVCGNNDFAVDTPEEEILEFFGQRILLCHGHRYRVKLSLDGLLGVAQQKNCSVVLFGHTHAPLCAVQNGVYLLNPGSIRGHGATYGILDITENAVHIQTFKG